MCVCLSGKTSTRLVATQTTLHANRLSFVHFYRNQVSTIAAFRHDQARSPESQEQRATCRRLLCNATVLQRVSGHSADTVLPSAEFMVDFFFKLFSSVFFMAFIFVLCALRLTLSRREKSSRCAVRVSETACQRGWCDLTGEWAEWGWGAAVRALGSPFEWVDFGLLSRVGEKKSIKRHEYISWYI